MLKPSNYNFITTNDEGELLMINTLKGSDSYLKVAKKDVEVITEILRQKCSLDEMPQDLKRTVMVLQENGYLIDDIVDENKFIKSRYIDVIGKSTLHLIILPTAQCNFRCRYCYENFDNEFMSLRVQNAIINYVKNNLRKYSSLNISWFGGEPLLALDIIENLSMKLLEICRFYKKPYFSNITTNGSLLSADVARKLIDLRISVFQITLDGPKEIHDLQRPQVNGMGSFDLIKNNLLDIKKHVENQYFEIVIRSNVSKIALKNLREYKKLLSDNFGKDKRFRFVFKPVKDLGGEKIGKYQQELISENDLKEMYEILLNAPGELHYLDNIFETNRNVCYAAKKNSYLIDSKGGISKCTCSFQNEESNVGVIDSKGNICINEYKESLWLCESKRCSDENCFYRPLCLGECCPKERVIDHKYEKRCPLEKVYMADIMRLLDKENECFKEMRVN